MNAKEIREMSIDPMSYGNPGNGIQRAKLTLMREIAAQLAEQNEKLNILLNPPIKFNFDKDDPLDSWKSPFGLQSLDIPMPIGIKAPRIDETLRDKFAMAALQGYLSTGNAADEFWVSKPENMSSTAKQAYAWAAAMMEARK